MSWVAVGVAKNIAFDAQGNKLNSTEKCMLLVLGDYYNDEEGRAWASVARLAENCCLTRQGAQGVLRRLSEKGLLEIKQRRSTALLSDTNNYFFTQFFWQLAGKNRSQNNKGGSQPPLRGVANDIGGGSQPPLAGVANDVGTIPYRTKENPYLEQSGQEDVLFDIGESSIDGAPKKSSEKLREQIIEEVHAYYIETLELRPNTNNITEKKRMAGRMAFDVCIKMAKDRTPEQAKILMESCVDSLSNSDWHMGRDPKTKNKKYIEWVRHLFPNEDKVQWWVNRNLEGQ